MAATAAASPHQSAQDRNALAHLAVGATVVRPVQLTPAVSAGGAGLLVRNAQGVDVQAVGGTTKALDENTVAVKPESHAIIVTITY